ncbi:glycerol acyltransferase [Pedobacter sp. LMG 31464]|uniref:Glycerol acyltransferase n=1 Tax=Pedobacter planticolens TaxID=2679964 RepID=A0A923DX25_9SPHI|nr:glycerol acyltransferase [Pedobacter planticolens]MBB2145577.1 glycerol acyltransferase [Pedobacter planticolens]
MYHSRKNGFIFHCYSWYINYILKKDFSAFTHNQLVIKEDEAVLLLANRFSWWDGFMLFQLNKKVFKKEFHALVTTDDYKQLNYLKYFGCFAPESKGKDVLETLLYAGSLLDDPKNLVLIFPQGKIKSSYVDSIAFEKGVMQLVNASKKKFQTVFSVILTDYFNNRKPKAKAYLTTWQAEEYISLQLLKSEYNKHYDAAVLKQTQKAS